MDETILVWPTKDHYNMAIERMEETVSDKEIRRGKLVVDKVGIKHIGGGRLYVCIYRIDDWIVRCFCKTKDRNPPKDIQQRYKEISAYCLSKQGKVAALLPIWYIPKGIEVDYIDENNIIQKTEKLPIVKMPYFHGVSLGTFIAISHNNPSLMQQLGDIWLRTIYELENASIAHGDLDLTNVLIRQEGNTLILKLIDYDNMWIPTLKDLGQTERGHEAFQHPKLFSSNKRPYDAEMDRFSALAIYISIRVLQNHPQLYDTFGADETNRLLLSPRDYSIEAQQQAGGRIEHLRALGIYGLESCLNELSRALVTGTMPCSVTELLALTTPPSTVPTVTIPSPTPPFVVIAPPTPAPDPATPLPSLSNQNTFRSLWDQKEYLKDPSLPLIPTPNQSFTIPPVPEPVAPPPVQVPPPPVQAPPPSYGWENPSEQQGHYAGSAFNWRGLIIGTIVAAVIILVLLAILWFTGVIHHPSTQQNGASLSAPHLIHTVLILYAPNLAT